MRILKILSVLAFGSLLAAPNGFAQVSAECNKPPDSPKPAFKLQADLWLTNAFSPDGMQCGLSGATTTPDGTTCLLKNRVWSDVESSCVNSEVLSPGSSEPNFSPFVFEAFIANDFKRYETDLITPTNWPGRLGADGSAWYIVWDHMVDPGLSSCKGYYGAQSDILQLGEFGVARNIPCEGGATPVSCVVRLRGRLNAELCDSVNTVDGTVTNIGGLAAVPIPVISGLSSSDFTTLGASITMGWVPACAREINDGAPDPLMGYMLEVFVDGNGDGICAPPAGCDADSGNFAPLAEIAPAAATGGGSGIAPLFIAGNRLSSSATISLSQIPLPAGVALNTVDCMIFRNRVMFQDDRISATGFGIDGPISPVLSLPSGRSAVVQNTPLAALISDFAAGFGKAKSVNLSWRVGADSFDTFRLSKSGDRNGTFSFVAEVRAVPGQLTYTLSDADALAGIERTKGKPTVWYLLEASGIGGTETAGPIPARRGKN